MTTTKQIFILLLLSFMTLTLQCVQSQDLKQYMKERALLVDSENAIKDGAFIHLTAAEQSANEIFTTILQTEELQLSNNDPSSLNFFGAKSIIETTEIFGILDKMPKGSILHAHQDSSATYDYLIDTASYLPNCYMYIGNDQQQSGIYYGSFYFFAQQPANSNWVLLSTLRQNSDNVNQFDQQLLTNLTLETDDFGDYVGLWRKFDAIFGRVAGLVSYLPATIGYMQHLVNQTIANNVQHIELRKVFGDTYDLLGNQYNMTWFVEQTIQLVDATRTTYKMPEFNIKIIGCDPRHVNQTVVLDHMVYALELRNQYPQMFVGYDLVGPEDEGYPLIYFIDQFMTIDKLGQTYKYPLDFYFHAGETLLYNNTNLYDAILLQSKRIGHGIQLSKHPVLMQLVKDKNIGIEVCPISNQVLEYVANFRAHPGYDLFNQGLPVTISPDDPAIFGYGGLTYDFYEVTTAWGLGIAELKQLALNSLNQSAYFDSQERELAINAWNEKWNLFINWLLQQQPTTSSTTQQQ
ncbi:hypothetical protein SAMD00019534_083450, partial [Acytostelium subglobosum LB1]|uniref:hypothetical protein n=1 Tax=Acytostelium subglobosum LB1 TaxID=1410327 RepID=UPI0006449CD6